jgi:acrylyl-CoA reductase (NADPH)
MTKETKTFRAYQVEQSAEKEFSGSVIERDVDELPAGDVLIEVQYSSLNYKDALSSSGNKAVTRHYPHTPGIDAAGRVAASSVAGFEVGEEVIVTGYDLGMNTAGGFGQFIRVPANWIVKRPSGLNLRESMILGTAGFTAALCVEKLILNGITPERGSVLVTGASGGVGIIAVALLSKLGYQVVASTGKASAHTLLQEMGAGEIIDRASLSEVTNRPLLKEQWAGAVDVVGGDTLFNVLKSLQYGGSVACCGLVQSPLFAASVLPFILRGVNLLGVDSVELPLQTKAGVWAKLASEWRLGATIEPLAQEIGFAELKNSLDCILQGAATGRFVLNLSRD